MAENNNAAFKMAVGNTGMTLNIDKEDLFAVGIANYEQGMLVKKKALTAEIRAASKRKVEVHGEMGGAVTALCSTIEDKKVQSFVRASKRVGIEVTVDTTFEVQKDGKIAGKRSFSLMADSHRRNSYAASVGSVTAVLDPTDQITALREEWDTLVDTLNEKGEALREVMEGLQNMSTKEREVRAHLVVKGLQGSEEGRALLATLVEDGNPFMLTINDDDVAK